MNNRPFFENARKNNTTLDGNTPDSLDVLFMLWGLWKWRWETKMQTQTFTDIFIIKAGGSNTSRGRIRGGHYAAGCLAKC